MKKETFLKIGFAFLIFTLSSLFITHPLIFHLGDYVTGFGDELVIAWIQNWVIHALSSDPLSLFQTNIYYPFENTLAFSDMHMTTAIIALPILILAKSPIALFNFTVISSLLFMGFFTWALSYYLSRNFLSSLLSGLLIVFSPAFLDKKVHIQILAVYFVPLSILFFIHFFKTKRARYFIFFLITFLLQMYNSFLPGYFIVFFCLIYSAWVFKTDRKKLRTLLTRRVLFGIILVGLLLLPVIIPYLNVAKDYGAKRDIRDSIHFALQPEDYFYPGEHTRLEGALKTLSNQMNYPKEASLKPGYLGLLFSILVILSFISYFRSKKRLKNIATPFMITALVGFILSLGPFLHLGRVTIHHPIPIPLPYALLYYIAPGFQGFRNSARWEMLFILCIAVVIAILLSKVLIKASRIKLIAVYSVCFLLLIWEFPFPMKFFSIPTTKDFPEIHSYLANLPRKEPVIFIPISSWNMSHPDEEMRREYFSTIHFTPMMNGYSGFTPPEWQRSVEKIDKDFPSNETIKDISKNGIRTIILDKRLIDLDSAKDGDRRSTDEMIKILDDNKNLIRLKTIDNYIIYKYKQ